MAVMLLLCTPSPANAQESCTPPLARVVSMQGTAEVRRAGADWKAAGLDTALCAGDALRVGARSRAALLLSNETTVRLDQGTTLTLTPPDPRGATLLEQISGGLHVITRTPRPFRVKTPFVNANVEGTEFEVRVETDAATISVYEGQVVAANDLGNLKVGTGERAIAPRGLAPYKDLLIRSADAVAWTLYFPSVFDALSTAGPPGTPEDIAIHRAAELYRGGDAAAALQALEAVGDSNLPVRVAVYRGALLLAVGRLDEARPLIEQVLRADSGNVDAHALLAIVALVQNDKETALQMAQSGTSLGPKSPAAQIALSYVQQGRFRLDEARAAIQRALELDPRNALAWARLAELEMSLGQIGQALDAARHSSELGPQVSRAHAVGGFANLTRADVGAAKTSFERAIVLDPADPLPRLGMGLAKIRDGDLKGGRVELEIASVLDPKNSLLRSYLGKAYYEERRDSLAATQFKLAEAADTSDPTPWLYDAILKQALNRPVEALQDLQRSIDLNDNRAVYRSRLLLDADQATRTAALARIDSDIGFDRLTLSVGSASIGDDPTSSSAHRLLADAYTDLSRHEIARSSELLQSQIRQPLGLNPIQLQLADDRYVVLRGSGPEAAGYNEYNALFSRDGAQLEANALFGTQHTHGDQLIASGVSGRWGYAVGQLAYGTEGYRDNDDFSKHVIDGFLQYQYGESLGVQIELRRSDTVFGDPVLRFDPLLFFPDRNNVTTTSYRLGGHYRVDPHSEVLASLIAVDSDSSDDVDGTPLIAQKFRTRVAELQHVWREDRFSLVSGVGTYSEATRTTFAGAPSDAKPRAHNAYAYATVKAWNGRARFVLGASDDHLEAGDGLNGSKDQFNPKVGVSWDLTADTTLRAAYFRVLKRRFFASQTLEPTQVAGFNQFFDDQNGTSAARAGIALDHRLSDHLFVGWEASGRNLHVPQDFTSGEVFDWKEREVAAHVYWAPNARTALSARYLYERFTRPLTFPGQELFTAVTTQRLPVQIDVRVPSGLSIRLAETLVRQTGTFFSSSLSPDPVSGSASFWVTDASLGYRLPGRLGMVSLDVKNLFDRRFQFQETDFFAPAFARRRTVLARASLTF
jgi:tetratricopeptide (TPR) repeat protein